MINSKYVMLWGGAWRSVANMWDGSKEPTTSPFRATAAVLYISEDEWVAVPVTPGDIVAREGRRASGRQWELV